MSKSAAYDPKPFKFRVGEKVVNKQVGEIQVLDCWHAKGGDFYDVTIIRNGRTWTFEESEMLEGYPTKSSKEAAATAAGK
jgi:hypothetical protein